MKLIYWIILGVVLLLVIGYFTNWFGIKKINNNISERRGVMSLNIVSCNPGCELSTDTTGASNTVTVGNVTYTCKCSDGSTSAPTL